MSRLEETQNLISLIEKGEIKVSWVNWFFSGGRTYGNGHTFILRNIDGSTYGYLMLNDMNGLDIRTEEGRTVCFELNDEGIVNKASDVLYKAIQRDDTEIVRYLTKNGEFIGLPRDYGDISREDVIEGRWSVDYMTV